MKRVSVIAITLLILMSEVVAVVMDDGVASVEGQNKFVTTHSIIKIDNNSDFASQASLDGWSGDGSEANPYVIESYDIDAHGNMSAIYIANTTVFFKLNNCTLYNVSYTGITVFNATNGILSNNSVLSVRGGIDSIGAGMFIESSENITLSDNNISYVVGGVGSKGGFRQNGDTGCTGAGIYLQSSSKNTIINNQISYVTGGKGGIGGSWGSGGTGGVGSGIYLQSSNNNTISNNKISSIDGGAGGDGGSGGSAGVSQVGFGIYIESDSLNNLIESDNSYNGDPILYYYGQNGSTIENYVIENNSNPTNFGKITVMDCTNFAIKNNRISNYSGETGETGGSQSAGGKGVGIYIASSRNITVLGNNISSINGGSGGASGPDGSGGKGGTGAGIYIQLSNNNSILYNRMSSITGGVGGVTGDRASGGKGGTSAGIYLKSSRNTTLLNNSISSVTGGIGNNGGSYKNGGTGGTGAGVYIQSSNNNTLLNTQISFVNGGRGGTGGYRGSGGAGGRSAGIYLKSSLNNTISNNNISLINGGAGGAGGSGGSAGVSQVGFGIYIETDSLNNQIEVDNSYNGDQILYYYEQNGATLENYVLENNSNPTNFGKIAVISCSNFTIKNNRIANYSGENGETGKPQNAGGKGVGIYIAYSRNITVSNNNISSINGGIGGTSGSGYPGGVGGTGAGIYILASDDNALLNNQISSITGGVGGARGYSRPSGMGGVGSGIYVISSFHNRLFFNRIHNIAGSRGGLGGIGAGIYFSNSTGNMPDSNVILNVTGGYPQVGFGIYLEEDALDNAISKNNTVDGDAVLYYYEIHNNTEVKDYVLTAHSNPTNYGKIAVINCSNFYIHNNTLANFVGAASTNGYPGAGIHIWSSSNNRVTDNNVFNITGGRGSSAGAGGVGGIGAGIYLSFSSYNVLESNHISVVNGGKLGAGWHGSLYGIGAGICISHSSHNNLFFNKLSNISGGDGGTASTQLNGGRGGIGGGIYIIYSSNNSGESNDISNISGGGGGKANPKFRGGQGGTGGTGAGIFLRFSDNNTFTSNKVYHTLGGNSGQSESYASGVGGGTGAGAYITASMNNSIILNHISDIIGGKGGKGGYKGTGGRGGIGTGTYITYSDENILNANRISQVQGGAAGEAGYDGRPGHGGDGIGLYVEYSENNTNIYNIISGIKGGDSDAISYGVKFYNSNNCSLIKNEMSYNEYGIYLSSSPFNEIYNNNIVENDYQAYDDNGNNSWNNTYLIGGNYWSDYSGDDYYSGPNQDESGSDGIGDTPYNSIDGDVGAIDNYPLVERLDVVVPQILLTLPEDGENGISVQSRYYEIEFTEPIDTSTFTEEEVKTNLPNVSWFWSSDGVWLNATFDKLSYNTTYYVILSSNLTDISGNPLTGDKEKVFTTVPSDTNEPFVSIESPCSNEFINSSSITVRWEGSDDEGINHYEVRVDGNYWINVGTNTSYTFIGVQDGSHTIDVKALDNASNEAMDYVSFIVDTVSPIISIEYPTDMGILNNSEEIILWNSSDATSGINHYEVRIDGGSWVDVGVEKTYDFTNISDGLHTVEVKAVDNATNEATDSVSFTVDVTAPTISITVPTNNEILNSSDVAVSWTGSDATTGINHYEIRIDGGTWTDVGTNTSYNLMALSDGSHTVELKAVDNATNEATATMSFIVDVTAPAISITAPMEGSIFATNSVTVSWTGSDATSGINHYEMRSNNGTWINMETNTSYTFSGVSDGVYRIDVRAIDNATNENMTSVTFTINTTAPADTTPPDIEITSPNDGSIIYVDVVAIQWSGHDTESGINHYEIRIDSGDWESVGHYMAHTFSELSDGSHTVDVKAIDNSGNENTDSVTFVVDTTLPPDTIPPTVVINEPTDGAEINETSVTISWSGNDDASGINHYEVRIDGTSWIDIGTNTTYRFTGLTNGPHTVDVKAVDNAGNEETQSLHLTVATEPAGSTGNSENNEAGPGSFPWWIFIIVVLFLLIILAAMKKRRKPEEKVGKSTANEDGAEEEPVPEEPEET